MKRFVFAFCLTVAGCPAYSQAGKHPIVIGKSFTVATAKKINRDSCTFNGIRLYGKVRVVEYGEDFKVRIVAYGEALTVKKRSHSPACCGEWQFVGYGEDFKVRFVKYGEDFTIRFASH